jgi:catechol 2,3-dioxygenase-like lactoylglutathione lyase family enzyme
MKSPFVAGLRSVALDVPDLARGEDFYTRVWHLEVAARSDDAIYLRGAGTDHHLLSLHRAGEVAIRHVTLRARSEAALAQIAERVAGAGGRIDRSVGPLADPAGGIGLRIADADGRLIEIVHGDAMHAAAAPVADRPERLAHVVLNSHAVDATQAFFEQALGFVLADRTRIMAFMNCNLDHHSVAIGVADNDCLNHIAFLMPDLDAVMRGAGRMRDAGFPIEWGPGRHGPGNNAFSYFVGPFSEVIEYTADVEQIDDSYRAGRPEDWTWPSGRVDQWGISAPPSARLKQAQASVRFAPSNAMESSP